MSGLVYPASLPGLTFNNTRTPHFNTGVQAALSKKESRIAYQQYVWYSFELQYSVLRDNVTPSDLQALEGLFIQMGGQFDTFLYSDPTFNTVALMKFATTDGVSQNYQITATYQNVGGPGGAELVQNFNGTPVVYIDRYGTLNELMSAASRTQQLLQSQTIDNASWTKTNVTITPNATTGPDGTATMDAIVESTATNVAHTVSQAVTVASTTNLTMTLSAFVRVGARNFGYLQMTEASGGSIATVWFNVSTGAVGTITTGANWSGVSATITPTGVNSIYRVTLTATKTNAATSITCAYSTATADNSLTYTGASSTVAGYGWGFQFELGSQATMYLTTTTTTVTQLDYTLGATGIIATTAVLAAAAALLWSGSFFYRCRFSDDTMTVTQFMNKLWKNAKVNFEQVKL